MRSSVALLLLLVGTLQAADEFRKALPGYHWQFPRDYFDHRDFRTEWWYYTGNLKTKTGRRFGFELTFFRHAVKPSLPDGANVWDIRDAWLAHFALSDLEGGQFHNTDRLNRSGPGLAGVDASKGIVWNGNWRVQWSADLTQKLSAIAKGYRVELTMRPSKPPVIHGVNGVSQKSAGAGRASHYVSLTRLVTSGRIELNGETFDVEGLAWMDHEFFTHSLEANQSGWDWFSLQFDDGSELMLYRLRRKDGSVEPYSSGTYVAADGQSRHLTLSEHTLEPSSDVWVSPRTKGRYPVQWTIRVPSLGIEATTTTRLRAQELAGRTGPSYWEGAIEVRGKRNGQPLSGSGYLEMTGYSGAVKMGE